MCSQTTSRPHGFSRSFYVLLQLLLTAFVSPIGAARRPVAGEALVLTYSQNIHRRSRVKPLYRTPRPQSAAVRVWLSQQLQAGAPRSCTANTAPLPKTQVNKNFKGLSYYYPTYDLLLYILSNNSGFLPCLSQLCGKGKLRINFPVLHKLSSHLTKRTNTFFLNQNHYCVATIGSVAKLTVMYLTGAFMHWMVNRSSRCWVLRRRDKRLGHLNCF